MLGYTSKEIKIKIDNFHLKPIIINNENKNIFLFNQILIEENTKKEIKLNILNINEELDIYYNFNIKNLSNQLVDVLLSSALYALNTYSTFSFYLSILTKFPKLYQERGNFCETLLLNIKYKGDLSRFDKKELYHIKMNGDSLRDSVIIDIFSIFNDIDYIRQKIKNEKKYKDCLFFYLEKYKTLFYNSLDMFQSYSFLMSVADSMNNIKIVLKCINNFTDFINIINDNKKHIIKLIGKTDKKKVVVDELVNDELDNDEGDNNDEIKKTNNLIIIDDFFNMEKIYDEGIKENVYNSLISIKNFEAKYHKIILNFFPHNNLRNEKKLSDLIFSYYRGLIIPKKEFILCLNFNQLENIKKFNNHEIFAIIDITSDLVKDDNFNFILKSLIKEINYDNIGNDLINFFSQNKFENYSYNSEYNNILENLINCLGNINGFCCKLEII